MTIIEEILAKHAGKSEVRPGQTIWIDVDRLMTHDVCGPGTIDLFHRHFGRHARVWNSERVVMMPDHYIHTRDACALRNRQIIRAFADEQKLPHYYDEATDRYRGVCHVALAEEGFTRPGEVMFGTDSHTCTAGAFGQFATGIGNTDAAFIMGTGRLWVKVPETLKIRLHGEMPSSLMAKDVILHIIGDLSVDGATYMAMEFEGDAVSAMSMEERMTLCNMVIEAGAKCGIIAPDEKTFEYLRPRSGNGFDPVYGSANADCVRTMEYDVSQLKPVVAVPFKPDQIQPANSLAHVSLDQCYIGSCTGGKMEDFRAAARILSGRTVKTKTVLVPATRQVESALSEEKVDGVTLHDIFIRAGAEIGPPSCAACLGGPEDTYGRLKGSEVCLSTTNRNFPGRMGSPRSKTYLASPLTVAASAVTGVITDPIEMMID